MFDLCKDQSRLARDRERIVRLMMSFNEPMVAPANHPAQPTPAYICTLKEERGFSVYIFLYLTLEKIGLLYRYSGELENEEKRNHAEEEAIHFAEQMGCLIDDLHFSSLLSEQQEKLLSTIPLFSPPTEATSAVLEEILEPVEAEEIIETPHTDIEEVVAAQPAPEITGIERATAVEEQTWEPQIFLSKFRRRAIAEKNKRDVVEALGRLMATL